MIDDRLIINPSGDLFDFAAESGLSELFSGLSAAAVTCSEDYCFSPEELGRLAGRREIPLLCGNLAAGRAAGIKNVRAVRYTPMLPMEISGYTVVPVPTGEPGEDIYEIKYNLLIKGERTVYPPMCRTALFSPPRSATRRSPARESRAARSRVCSSLSG